jgi:hypothetical protein
MPAARAVPPGARGATHPDFAALRRHLVDEAFMDRAGGVYWRAGGTVDVEGPPEE